MPKYNIEHYRPHPTQVLFHEANLRGDKDILVTSSIRAGKSMALIHQAIVDSWNNPTPHGTLICAPTYKLLTTVLEKPMVSLMKSLGLVRSSNFTEHECVLKNGKVIYFRSLDDPDIALRGLNVWKAFVDELGYCSEYAIDLVRGRLLTTNGTLVGITTPTGLNSWLYTGYYQSPHPDVTYLRFNLLDNPIITEDAIERYKSRLDPLLYRQEVLGEWVNTTTDMVYHQFSEENVGHYPESPDLPIYIGLDFNLDKNAWVALQKHPNNVICVVGEGYGATRTHDVAQEIIQRYGPDVCVIADATGIRSRVQGIGLTQWQLLRQAGLNSVVKRKSNQRIHKRIEKVNSVLCNAIPERRLFFDQTNAAETIKEIRDLTYKKGSNIVDDKSQKVGHRTDALGYALHTVDGTALSQTVSTNLSALQQFQQRTGVR